MAHTDKESEVTNVLVWIDDVIRDICEIPDRFSPDDFPEAMVVTATELRDIIERHCPEARVAPSAGVSMSATYVTFDAWWEKNESIFLNRIGKTAVREIWNAAVSHSAIEGRDLPHYDPKTGVCAGGDCDCQPGETCKAYIRDRAATDSADELESIASEELAQHPTAASIVRRVAASLRTERRTPGYMGDVNGPGCDPDVP